MASIQKMQQALDHQEEIPLQAEIARLENNFYGQ
jgi:hypothetical protein